MADLSEDTLNRVNAILDVVLVIAFSALILLVTLVDVDRDLYYYAILITSIASLLFQVGKIHDRNA